jgi:DNA-binding CsgD family transcriptional regulator
MALTSRDETDLLMPLFSGFESDEPFTTFLERLRRRSGSSYAGLLVEHGSGEEHRFYAGADFVKRAHDLDISGVLPVDREQRAGLRVGRVYDGEEFNAHDADLRAQTARAMRKLQLADLRIVRVLDEKTVSAWLVIASAHPCSAADGALLSSLLPYVAATVRRFILDGQQRLASSLHEAGLDRAGNGWIAFDRLSRIVAMAPSTAQAFVAALGQAPSVGQRLREGGLGVERELLDAAAQFAATAKTSDRALVLLDNPRIEAVLSAFDDLGVTGAVMTARCRHPRNPSDTRADHFARLNTLPRREAELAILLADGHSLAEAGQLLGLTIETTRNYSKRLFAKMGVRGQAELVRAVYESCAMLA